VLSTEENSMKVRSFSISIAVLVGMQFGVGLRSSLLRRKVAEKL